MQPSEQMQLAYVLVFFLVGAGTVGLILTISSILRPRRPSREKLTTYECAEVPVGSGWFRLNLRFYTIALIFIVFDVELIAVLPVALVYRDWVSARLGAVAFAEIFAFVGVLVIGLAYVWRKGDLEWFKQIPRESVAQRQESRDSMGWARHSAEEGVKAAPRGTPLAPLAKESL